MATYRAELKQSFDIADGDDVQKYFTGLNADPTTTSGLAVQATTPNGTVTVPLSNVIGIIEVSS
jgi:hypothetical protein